MSRICLPAATELGLLFGDKVGAWRANNAIEIALKAKAISEKHSMPESFCAHPRIAMKVLEEGSWSDDDDVQSMWAGLLILSCGPDGKDETNLIFTNMLAQLTHAEASILKYSCEKSEKKVTNTGLVVHKDNELMIDLDELVKLTGVNDIHRLDLELDHLRVLGLIGSGISGGFSPESTSADISPSALALHIVCSMSGTPRITAGILWFSG